MLQDSSSSLISLVINSSVWLMCYSTKSNHPTVLFKETDIESPFIGQTGMKITDKSPCQHSADSRSPLPPLVLNQDFRYTLPTEAPGTSVSNCSNPNCLELGIELHWVCSWKTKFMHLERKHDVFYFRHCSGAKKRKQSLSAFVQTFAHGEAKTLLILSLQTKKTPVLMGE
jgi:hypothetical protein